MKKLVTLSALLALILVVYSCKKSTEKLTGAAYLDLPAKPYVYDQFNTTDNYNNKVALGRVLFYDGHLSVNNAISCGSCHKQSLGFADNVALSVGYEGRLTKRNSKGIANLNGDKFMFNNVRMAGSPLFWDGREFILQDLVARPITNHVEMGINDFNALAEKLSKLSYYDQLLLNAYGEKTFTTDRISESIALFLAAIRSTNSKFDKFAGQMNTNTLNSLERQGYLLFTGKYNCESCHHIFQNSYSTFDFKDIGLDENYADKGRGAVSAASTDNGKFRVPSLTNVGLTAPYMHDGRFKTLDEVIEHYSHGINNSPNLDGILKDASGHAKPMNISDGDKQALIAFLNTMTDVDMITDPKFSNPFKLK